MDLTPLLDRLPEPQIAALFGLLTGIVFGIAAQRSAFCLRAAAIELAEGRLAGRIAVWFLAFSTAVAWVQAARFAGLFNPDDARIMSVAGSWSGAILGGLMFGAGMILSRGCSGRLLVLAATGNLRAAVAGLVFALAAQMSLHGWLAPLRTRIAALSVTPDGRNLDLIAALGLPEGSGLALGLALAVLGLLLVWRTSHAPRMILFGSGVGFAVAMGWVLTWTLAQQAFDPVSVSSVTFTGPSANTLMLFLVPAPGLEFDVGLVPGVFLGAFLAAWWAGELQWQGFDGPVTMRRMLTGAVLMGFGGMLAGGCSIGAALTGGSVFAATAWLATLGIWVGGMATHRLLDAAPRR